MAWCIIFSGTSAPESWVQGDDSLQMLLFDGELCSICSAIGTADFKKKADQVQTAIGGYLFKWYGYADVERKLFGGKGRSFGDFMCTSFPSI
jgi:hypothetical protein